MSKLTQTEQFSAYLCQKSEKACSSNIRPFSLMTRSRLDACRQHGMDSNVAKSLSFPAAAAYSCRGRAGAPARRGWVRGVTGGHGDVGGDRERQPRSTRSTHMPPMPSLQLTFWAIAVGRRFPPCHKTHWTEPIFNKSGQRHVSAKSGTINLDPAPEVIFYAPLSKSCFLCRPGGQMRSSIQ